MLAMPLATTMRLVAERKMPAWAKASRPMASPYHSVPKPSFSISAATSRCTVAGCWDSDPAKIPSRPGLIPLKRLVLIEFAQRW